MDNTAFARARKYLHYHPVAEGVAISSSVLTALLFFGLILLLALFVDLVVNRGEVPNYLEAPPAQRTAFHQDMTLPEEADLAVPLKQRAARTLEKLGLTDAELRRWFAGDAVEQLSYRERALLWYVDVAHDLNDAVGPEASDRLLEGVRKNIALRHSVDAAITQPVGDLGLLSLVVRTHGTLLGRLVALLAAWNSWTWADGNMPFLFGLFGLALLLAAVRFGTLFLSNYSAAVATLAAVTRLRRAVYYHANRLGTLALSPGGPAEAVGAASNNLDAIHEALYRWLTVLFREPVKAALLLLFALVINFWLAMAFLLFAVLVWMVGDQVASVLRRQARAARTRAARELSLLEESMTLPRLVKGYLMEAFNQTRVERHLAAYVDSQRVRYRNQAIYRPLFALLGLFATLILLLAAGYIVLNGELGVAGALVVATALVCLYWPVRALLETRRTLRHGRDGARALFAFLERPGGIGQAIEAEFLPPLSRAIEFDKVSLQEPGNGRKLLRGVSLRIEAGQRVALVGPDPAEKQALVSLVPRFLDPTGGEVRIDGKNLRWVTLDSLRTQMALVLQPSPVFNDTVANNIGCGDPAYNLQRIIDAAKTAHAHQFIQRLPQGYETPIGTMGHALNASEMYRIALARAILRDPALYIIEEPATPLDDDTKALIDDTMQRILPGRTVIFLPQRLSTIRNCDQVVLLYQGRIEATGEHRELLSTSDLYKHLQYLQFNEFAGLLGPAPATVAEESRG
jgi:ATP-binding cassette subfamily B protein